jgi:hypothetical protein
MSDKIVQAVVTLSGTLDVKLQEGMTASDVKALAMEQWNIDENQIHEPFVVLSDMVTNASTLCSDEEELYPKVRQNGVLRVVLPLVPKE